MPEEIFYGSSGHLLAAVQPAFRDYVELLYSLILAEQDVVFREDAKDRKKLELLDHLGADARDDLYLFEVGISAVLAISVIEVLAELGQFAKQP